MQYDFKYICVKGNRTFFDLSVFDRIYRFVMHRFSVLFCFLIVFELSAQAVLPASCITRPFDNTDFNLNGIANFQPPGTFEITSAVNNQFGSVWYRRRLDLRVNFRLAFDVFLGNNDNPGADGLAFVLQNLDTGQGSAGAGVGYGSTIPGAGISPSIAIEFDTHYNAGLDTASQSDHVAFVLDGDLSTPPPAADNTDVNNLENGSFHAVVLLWDPDTQVLSFELTHSDGTVYTNSKNINLINHLSSNIAYWGFTAATGAANNRHLVRMDDNSICVVDATFPVTVGNNYHTSLGTVSLTTNDFQYLCSLFAGGFYNTAYHNGENLEPVVGDYILYNNLYPPPQRLVQGSGFAVFKLFDYNKIVEVRKSDGEIIAVYNCP